MAEYQNIFTQVQVKGPPEMGMDEAGNLSSERTKSTRNNTWLGYIGNAQLGPIHLGMFGVVSIYLGVVWFFLVGFGMLQQVNFDFALFIRTLFWLSLNPPPEQYGLSFPPINTCSI